MKKLIIALVLISIYSCDSKEGYVEEYSNFIDGVLENYKSFSDEEWKESDSLFKEFSVDRYEEHVNDCSEEEIALLNQMDAIYLGLKVKVEAERILDK